MVVEVVQFLNKGSGSIHASKRQILTSSVGSSKVTVVTDPCVTSKVDFPDDSGTPELSCVLSSVSAGESVKVRHIVDVPDVLTALQSSLFVSRFGHEPVSPSERAVAMVYYHIQFSWKRSPYRSALANVMALRSGKKVDVANLGKVMSADEPFSDLWLDEYNSTSDLVGKEQITSTDVPDPFDTADNDYGVFIKEHNGLLYDRSSAHSDIADFVKAKGYDRYGEKWVASYSRWIYNNLVIDSMEISSSKAHGKARSSSIFGDGVPNPIDTADSDYSEFIGGHGYLIGDFSTADTDIESFVDKKGYRRYGSDWVAYYIYALKNSLIIDRLSVDSSKKPTGRTACTSDYADSVFETDSVEESEVIDN